jgi:porin
MKVYQKLMFRVFLFLLMINTLLFGTADKHYDEQTVLFTEGECNAHGGTKQGCWPNLYFNSDLWSDATLLGLDERLTFDLALAGILSNEPSANYIGDFQTASNIDAPSRLLIYSAALSYRITALHDLELSAGLIDLNTIYDVTDSAQYLINSSFGISAALSANGAFSIYPVPGYGFNATLAIGRDQYNAGVFDANPTRREQPISAGVFSIAQWKRTFTEGRSLQAGAWYVDSYAGATHGFYGGGEWTLRRFGTFFLRVAGASGGGAIVPLGIEAGWLKPSPFSWGKQDCASAGIAQARFNGTDAETAYEITYLRQQNQWFALQPDLQYITHLSGTQDNAVVMMLRAIFSYDFF